VMTIDGEDRDLVALAYEIKPKLIDQGGFARARDPADADAHGAAGVGEQAVEQRLCARLILSFGTFNESDGAGKRNPVAAAYGLGDPLRLAPRFGVAPHGDAA